MEMSSFLVSSDITVFEVMEVINKNAKGVVFVCEGKNLIGVITDGDIRRYILQHGNLSDVVLKAVNREAIWLETKNEKYAMQLMQQKLISAIPILNERKEIVKIYFSSGEVVKTDAEKSLLTIPLVIMAGGKGTRLKPYTDILPKPLIPVGDKTITEHIMERFFNCGCSEIYMIVNYKKEFIKAYFQEGNYKDIIKFVEEPIFLGTGGGLKFVEDSLKGTFFMSNCDILIDADYAEILNWHYKEENIITMVCAKKDFNIPYGTVAVNENNHVISLIEKPSNTYLVNTGLYVIEPDFLKKIPVDTVVHITNIIQLCIKEKERVGVYTIDDDNWMDMGQLDELEKMKQKLGFL